ncbi:hypothetical protein BC833DRAFT_110163 [Globomyces pollinis-pini]|nr:hypothetical protein BC833DRAFT_110163 [Globomyces pollinis-pini]
MSESERTPTFWLQWINLKRGKMDTNQLKSSIKSILDRINSQKYKDDHDLLLLWIEYINLEILQNQPYSIINDLFKLLGRSNIGVNHSLLYTTWAKFECQSKHLEKAREILRVAIQSKVQPLNLLQDTLEYVNSIDGSDIPKENMHNVDLLKVTQGPNRRPLQEKLPRSVSLESHFSKRLEESGEYTQSF